jgi:hypothetical protein
LFRLHFIDFHAYTQKHAVCLPPDQAAINKTESSQMNIQYRKIPDRTRPEGYTFYPLLRVFLRHELKMQYMLALVDSGSADCVFPASIAELLQIDIPSGLRRLCTKSRLQLWRFLAPKEQDVYSSR